LREQHPVFRRHQFFHGTPAPDTHRDDIDWYRPDGGAMTGEDWGVSYAQAITVALSGATGERGGPDDPFLLMINAWSEPVDFSIPEPLRDTAWQVEVDTAQPDAAGRVLDGATGVQLIGRSLILLRGAPA
ncbi:MAG TPA: hypothetical protein VNR66_01135, partial [Solirubrobacteraceae bacterium]|nr:hypothetical protein [Solirubrobacteraceae bacterium]